ncbi:MAG: hypothetical protein OHK0015_31370 [Chloroflexi bacterium OHK40]
MGTAVLPERAAGAAALARWRDYLLSEVDGASLGVFRILFGAIMVWEVLRYVRYGWIARYYIDPGFHFSYLPFIQPWPGAGMYWHFALTGVLALLVALGLWYRVAAWLFAACFTYIFLLDKAQYLNHFYLICLLSLLLAITPAHRALSLDARRAIAPGRVPRWSLHVLRFQVGLVYFFGAVAKLNADWLAGEPLGEWLARRADLPLIGPLLAWEGAGLLFAWGGLLVDLSLPFLLAWGRTFWLGAAVAVAFNLLNAQIFSIGIFPWMMIAALTLFPRPDWPRAILGRAGASRARRPRPGTPPASRAALALLVALHLYALVQLTLPLRHWLYPSDVAWSEEGHRFSWRMKLRDKAAEVTFYVSDPRGGERHAVDARRWLTARQESKMASRPDMIHQFARFVADEEQRRTGVRPIVTAEAWAGLNGREPALLVDPTVDLASEPYRLGPAPWITRPPR